jgi:hypothetical protein
VTEDLHSPTTAGPEPTPTVGPSEATTEHPAGTAKPAGGPFPIEIPADRPELLVGAAFAGGLVAALILKRLGR